MGSLKLKSIKLSEIQRRVLIDIGTQTLDYSYPQLLRTIVALKKKGLVIYRPNESPTHILSDLAINYICTAIGAYKPKVRTCRGCGCTDDDCSQCIKKTGQPCHWVEEDLCSACLGKEEKLINMKGGDKMPTIDFKFSPNDKVKTAIGDIGLVTSCSISSGAVKQYWVLMNNGRGAWFDENQLTAAE